MPKAPVTYEIIEELGQGGMCVVYKAWQLARGRLVALKLPKPTLLADVVSLERFIREARLNSRLNHEHIVKIYEIDESGGVPYIAMEYVDGVTLLDILQAEPSLPMTLHLCKQIAAALNHAHNKGVIHRDLKPSNILVDYSLNVRVADWGMAKALNDSQGLTKTGMILGTPDYMAPEQLKDEELTHKTDLYALGLIVFELVTHRQAFTGETLAERVAARLRKAPPLISDFYPEVPSVLVDLTARLLLHNPSDRPEDIKEVLLSLEETEEALKSGDALARQGATIKVAKSALEQRRDSSSDDSSHFPLPSSVRRRTPGKKEQLRLLSIGGALLMFVLFALFAWNKVMQSKPKVQTRTDAKCTAKLLSLTELYLSCRYLPAGEYEVTLERGDKELAQPKQTFTVPPQKNQISTYVKLPKGADNIKLTITSLSLKENIYLTTNRDSYVDELLKPLDRTNEASLVRIARPLATFRSQGGRKPGEDTQARLLELIEPIGLDKPSLVAIAKNIKGLGKIPLGSLVARRLLILRRLESLLQEKQFQPLPWGAISPHLSCRYFHVDFHRTGVKSDTILPLPALRGREAKGTFKKMKPKGFIRLATPRRLAVMDNPDAKNSLSKLLRSDGSVDLVEFEFQIEENFSPWPPQRTRLSFTCYSLFPDFEVTFVINGSPLIIHNYAGIMKVSSTDALDAKHCFVADIPPAFVKRGKNTVSLSCQDLPGARAMNRLSLWSPLYLLFDASGLEDN